MSAVEVGLLMVAAVVVLWLISRLSEMYSEHTGRDTSTLGEWGEPERHRPDCPCGGCVDYGSD